MNTIKASNLGKCEKGFALIEVMIALVILVIGVLGVLYMQLASVKGNSSAIGLSRAVHEAYAGLDRLQYLAFSDSSDAALNAGTNKTSTDIFGNDATAQAITDNLDSTLSYDVVELTAAQLQALFNYADPFPGASGKRLTVRANNTISGNSRTIQLEYVKIYN